MIALRNKPRPDFEVHELLKKLLNNQSKIQKATIDLIGTWKVKGLMGEVLKIVVNTKIENVLRVSAINVASNLGGQEALSSVVKLANDINDPCQ